VSGLTLTSVASGTCLTQTRIFIGPLRNPECRRD
jgi:hypothetical protein